MKRKKPTRKELETGPSLWTNIQGYLLIVYPDGKNEFMFFADKDWSIGVYTRSVQWVLSSKQLKFVDWV